MTADLIVIVARVELRLGIVGIVLSVGDVGDRDLGNLVAVQEPGARRRHVTTHDEVDDAVTGQRLVGDAGHGFAVDVGGHDDRLDRLGHQPDQGDGIALHVAEVGLGGVLHADDADRISLADIRAQRQGRDALIVEIVEQVATRGHVDDQVDRLIQLLAFQGLSLGVADHVAQDVLVRHELAVHDCPVAVNGFAI